MHVVAWAPRCARGWPEPRSSCPSRRVADGDHVYHLFIVRTTQRDALREHLDAHGVSSAVHYPFPIHRTEAYADLGLAQGSLPVAERLAEEILHAAAVPDDVRPGRRAHRGCGALVPR